MTFFDIVLRTKASLHPDGEPDRFISAHTGWMSGRSPPRSPEVAPASSPAQGDPCGAASRRWMSSGSAGLVRWASNPASRARRLSSSAP